MKAGGPRGADGRVAHRIPELWDAAPGYLNTATYGLPPHPTLHDMHAALDGWRSGRTDRGHWEVAVERARASFGRLVGAEASTVAVGSQVSSLVGLVAAALPDKARVLVPDIEFTSNVFPYLVQAGRGVEVVTAPVDGLVDAIDERTTAVAYSVVQSATGEITDMAAVAEQARAYGAITIADATQAVGWLPVEAGQADALVCGAYKWLMAPRGTAFLVIAPELAERTLPLSAGWFAGADPDDSYYGLPLRLATDARRFDVSPGWFDWVGTATSLAVVESIGVQAVHAHDVALANRFRAGLGMAPGHSAIVSLDRPGAAERFAQAGIVASVRAGSVRAAFHLYTTEADVDAAVAALTER
ncbi:MAG TPA: aminotransferase class V-fold PLP-dependent enzyme [Mycobacteriales bacterium]